MRICALCLLAYGPAEVCTCLHNKQATGRGNNLGDIESLRPAGMSAATRSAMGCARDRSRQRGACPV